MLLPLVFSHTRLLQVYPSPQRAKTSDWWRTTLHLQPQVRVWHSSTGTSRLGGEATVFSNFQCGTVLPYNGPARWTALQQLAGDEGGRSAPPSWREKVEESKVWGGTVKHQSPMVRKHPSFYPHEVEGRNEDGCSCQYGMCLCPFGLRSGPLPVPTWCNVLLPPNFGLWGAGSTSDLYET